MDGVKGPEQRGDAIDQKLEELKAQHAQQEAPAPIDIETMAQAAPPVDGISPKSALESPEPEKRGPQRIIGITLIVLSLIVAGLFALTHFGQKPSSTAQLDASNKYSAQASPAPTLTAKLSSVGQSNTLTVNGLLSVTGSLFLTPSVQPPSAVAGELYYDSSKNLLGYYNGTQFIYPQGGGNVTNTTINNITSPAVTNVTNITNVSGGGMTGSGTAGQLAMFTGPSALGDSLINQTGSSINTGAGVESVALGSQAGASDTTLQGGTGNVTINTGAGSSTTGNVTINTGASSSSTGGITIQSGDSSTTAAGNITIDTGASILNGTVVDDKTFENGTDNMGDNIFGNNSTITQSSAQARTGTHSLAVAVGSNFFPEWGTGEGTGNPPFLTPVTAGHTYNFSAWVRADTSSAFITGSVVWSNDGYGGGGQISAPNFGSATDINTGWRHISGILTAPVGAVRVGVEFISFNATSVGEIHYFDDITVTDLSSSASTAAINLGATNAQIINIGNSAMLAPTSIFGSGINLTGGAGILNMTASTITAAAGGATYSTSTGALDIYAATSSVWKVGGSGGTGYDLSVQAGDAGANGNGGNLYLQGGASAGTGTGGSVIVKPQTDSAKAFQVQNAAGNTALAVDSGNGILTLNTASSCNYSTYGTYLSGLGPYSAWNLEDTGGTAADSSGNGNTGTLSNVTVNQTPGPFSCANTHPAMAFNAGSPSQITTTNSAAAPGTYSIVAMFKTLSDGMIVSYTDGGGNNDRQLLINGSGHLVTQFWNVSNGWQTIASPGIVNDNNWHIAAATVSATNGEKLFLDGSLVASNAAYTTPENYTGKWIIGIANAAQPYTGQLGQVATFSTELNALQAQTLATYSGFYSATLAAIGVGTTAPAANLDIEGTGLFKNGVDSTSSFQIQNATGTPLMVADTAHMVVDVNALNVHPASDTASVFQVQNAGGTSIINVDTQTQLINDPMVASAPTGTLLGSAAWVSGQYLELNNGATTDGDVNYTASPGTSFDATFNFWGLSGGADSTFFYAYNTSVPGNPNGYGSTSGGYIFNYDEFHGDAEIWFNGTELASSPVGGIASSTWHSAEVIRNGTAFTMKMDGSTVLAFTDTARVLSGNNFGINGYSGAFSGEHRADDFVLSAGTAPAILTVAATAQFTSDLAVSGTITAPNITVQALAVTAMLSVNGHIVSGGTAISTFSPGAAQACTGGGSVGVTGNDVSGTISITTGAGPCASTGGLIDVSFANAFSAAPHVILTPAEPNAATLQYYYTSSNAGFTVSTGTAPQPATTYNYAYLVVQ